jgi:hypothetical protein
MYIITFLDRCGVPGMHSPTTIFIDIEMNIILHRFFNHTLILIVYTHDYVSVLKYY